MSLVEPRANDGKAATAVFESIQTILPGPVEERFSLAAPHLYPPTARGVPLKTRVRLYRHGLHPRAYHIYDFERYDYEDYLPEQNKTKGEMNEPLSGHLKNKQKFYTLMESAGFGSYLPERYGELSDGQVSDQELLSLLETQEKLVLKSKTGWGGYDVIVLESGDDSLYLNKQPVPSDVVQETVQELDGYLVTEFCEQADYAAQLYPGACNTVRFVTIKPAGGNAYVPIAVQRIGTAESGHVDNCSQGGLTARIDSNGRLSAAGQFVDDGVDWHDTHPDSGAQITGTVVPGWKRIREAMVSLVDQIGDLRYVGWDLVITGPGEFKIIEGQKTDIDLLQIHEPLLRNERTRRFFEAHGVV
jgi:hypothetical protein